MDQTKLAELAARVAQLRDLDLDALAKRVAVIDRRVEIEEQRGQLAIDCDADEDAVLLAIGAAWSERLPMLVDDPDLLVRTVLADVRVVLESLAGGWIPTHPPTRRIRSEVIAAVQAGARPVAVRKIFESAGRLVGQMQ